MNYVECPSCSNRIHFNNAPAIRTCQGRSCKVEVYIYGSWPDEVKYLDDKKRELTAELLKSNNRRWGLHEEILGKGERRVLSRMKREGKVKISNSEEGGRAWWLTEEYEKEVKNLAFFSKNS